MPVRSHERDVAYSLLRIADSLTTAWSPCSKAGIDNDSRYWRLEHDPEKWVPVFGKRSCSNMKLEQDDDSATNYPAPEHDPEKWVPVFGKRSCSNMKLEQGDDSATNYPALVRAPLLRF